MFASFLKHTLFLALLASPFICYAAEGQDSDEILLARKVANQSPVWCGNKPLLIYKIEDSGLYWSNVETGESDLISDLMAQSIGCTPDGEWLIYVDKNSTRWDDSTYKSVIVDLWRYEFKTKKKQKFAIVNDQVSSFGEESISRDGKLYLPKQPKTNIKMPEPKWELIWSDFVEIGDAVWLHDAKTVLAIYWGNRDEKNELIIDTIEPKRKTTRINPGLSSPDIITVDESNTIYIKADNSSHSKSKKRILKCEPDLNNGNITCNIFLESENNIVGFQIFRDHGTVVFTESDGNCVLKASHGERAECLTSTYQEVGYHLNISPDGKWLAFTVFSKYEKNGKRICT